jgi:hypothetical protein
LLLLLFCRSRTPALSERTAQRGSRSAMPGRHSLPQSVWGLCVGKGLAAFSVILEKSETWLPLREVAWRAEPGGDTLWEIGGQARLSCPDGYDASCDRTVSVH